MVVATVHNGSRVTGTLIHDQMAVVFGTRTIRIDVADQIRNTMTHIVNNGATVEQATS
ncbi:hypothetical protein [Mycobacterium lepromatosis]|uniref:hypothetical protein n=1 Tax=Mycobacterium lepromatosis TaxID=480418 RepID=UPI000AAA18B9|nr:hypothetical protein [Mycobacterium lepromatosis]